MTRCNPPGLALCSAAVPAAVGRRSEAAATQIGWMEFRSPKTGSARAAMHEPRRRQRLCGQNVADSQPPSGYCVIWLDTCENTLLALPPISRTVPITITRMTASITAYSATSCPCSSIQSWRIRSFTFPPSNGSFRGSYEMRLKRRCCNNSVTLANQGTQWPTRDWQWHFRAMPLARR